MTQQKNETQLTHEATENIAKIIRFLNTSTKYNQQTELIETLRKMMTKVRQGLDTGNNVLQSKGSTGDARTIEWLKIAIAHTKDWKPVDNHPFNSQEKAKLINHCMMSLKTHIAHIPSEIIRHTSEDLLTDKDRINATKASPKLFKAVWTVDRLLSAVFMGEEDIAAEIVRVHPDFLFTKRDYIMPILNQDGTPSNTYEQKYDAVTPLQLMLYTGDWKMWERILPLIPEARLEETLQEMKKIQRGGPDLVKIDRDPTKLSVGELQHYHVKDAAGKQVIDQGRPVVYDLLCNSNGIFYLESGNQVRFFKVEINSDTQEKTVTELPVPANLTAEDQAAWTQLQNDIHNNLPMNSSRRTSDAEHALIQRIFGVTLERNGIHYTLNDQVSTPI